MAINFPASPSTNDTHTENAITWIFNGTSWDSQGEQVTAASIGLGSVDNTSDADKPVSTATQTALDDRVAYSAQTPTDAEVRLANANLRGSFVFNAKHYGAEGDGVTDDTVAIQAALDAAEAAGGGAVFLPSGTYRVGLTPLTYAGEGGYGFNNPLKNSIMLRDNVELRGEGRENTIIKPLDAAPNNMPILYGETGCQNITVSNLWVDGNNSRAGQTVGAENEGINFKTSTNCWVVNCKVTDTGQDGVDFDGVGSKGGVLDTIIEDCWGSGIHCAGGGMSDMLFSRLRIEGCSDERQSAEDPLDTQNGTAGLDIKGGSRNVVSDCIIISSARAMGLFGCTVSRVENCTLISTSATLPALWLKGSSSSGNLDVTITNSYIAASLASSSALIEFAARFARFDDCIIGGKYGINIGDGNITGREQGGEVHVNNCEFRGVTYGVWVQDTDDFAGSGALRPVFIDGCKFSSTLSQCIRVACACKGSVSNSKFQVSGSSKIGVSLRAEADDDWIIDSNICTTTAQSVYIRSGSAGVHTIQNNIFSGGEVFTAENNSIFRGNTFYDIELSTAGAATNRFENNNILNSVIDSGTLSAHNNAWKGNHGAGAYAEGGTAVLAAGTVTVNSDIIPAGAKVTLTRQVAGGTVGHLSVGTITAGTSFAINSSSATDTSTIFWKIEQ